MLKFIIILMFMFSSEIYHMVLTGYYRLPAVIDWKRPQGTSYIEHYDK
jgi:hypothetical protein